MDASDYGLCALFPARHEFLQVKFTSAEREQIERFNRSASSQYCINVRELMSAVFHGSGMGAVLVGTIHRR